MAPQRRAIWSWASIDLANSAFAIVVMTAFFPALFKDFWTTGVAGMTPERSTAVIGFTNTIASLLVAVAAPILGSIADQGNMKKRFLAGFTLLGAAATAALPLAGQGHYVMAAVFYAIAAFGFSGNNMFSDALITDVGESKNYDRISALGYALGYVGSGVLFAFLIWVVSNPEALGFTAAVDAVRMGFWVTAAWWLLFTVPALVWVHETPGRPAVAGTGSVFTRGFRQFATTFRDLRADRRLLYFLGGYLLYIDGVNTVIKMAVTFGGSIGIDTAGMMKALLVTQFVAFPAAIVFGRIGERFGAKRGIMAAILVYAGVCGYATRMDSPAEFFVMAVVIGLVQGGVQSLSRSFFARLIPAEKGGEYFGFYNMIGKFASVLGPSLMAVTALLTDSRTSILSLLLLFGAGAWLLAKVQEPDANANPDAKG